MNKKHVWGRSGHGYRRTKSLISQTFNLILKGFFRLRFLLLKVILSSKAIVLMSGDGILEKRA